MRLHLLEFATSGSQHSLPHSSEELMGASRGILEVVTTAVGGVEAFELKVAASLAWRLPVAFYLPSLTFIAVVGRFQYIPLLSVMSATYQAIEM